MPNVPQTSTTLLKDISDSQHARWSEFVARYRPMMEVFLRERFPYVDADEIIQETFVALVRVLPDYVYCPEETGHFRNYLTGILRHKALRQCRKDARLHNAMEAYRNKSVEMPGADDGEKEWQTALFEVALQQLLADKSIQGRTKQVFVRVAVNGESPDDVAAAFKIERNAVDQIKSRMTAKLRKLVDALEKAGKTEQ